MADIPAIGIESFGEGGEYPARAWDSRQMSAKRVETSTAWNSQRKGEVFNERSKFPAKSRNPRPKDEISGNRSSSLAKGLNSRQKGRSPGEGVESSARILAQKDEILDKGAAFPTKEWNFAQGNVGPVTKANCKIRGGGVELSAATWNLC